MLTAKHHGGVFMVAVLIAVTSLGHAPTPARAEGGVLTHIEFTRTHPVPPAAYAPTVIYFKVTPETGYANTFGTAYLFDVTNGGEVLLGSAGGTTSHFDDWWIILPGFPVGQYTLEARFEPGQASYEPSVSAPLVLTVEKAPVNLSINQYDPIEANHGFVQWASVGGPSTWASSTGKLEIWRVGAATPYCSITGFPNSIECTIPALPVGTHEFYAKFTGDAQLQEGESAHTTVTVIPDVVHGSIGAPTYTTFYPVTDTYRDSVRFAGSRSEPISGTIKIYTPGGSLIKAYTIATGTGGYGFTWYGRNSSGSILAEGKYRIVTTLKDGANLTKTATQYVTLSRKRLIWHAATITKNGSAYSASGTAGSGTVRINTTYGWVRLRALDYSRDWAGAGWQFTLATGVAYRYVVVKAYAKHSAVFGYARLGSQNFAKCPYTSTGTWAESCFDAWKALAGTSGSLVWTSTASLTSTHRSGNKVRSTVAVNGSDVYVYKARVSYQYATLGY